MDLSMNQPQFVPPVQNGVGASKVFLPAQAQAQTLFEFLCLKFTHISMNEWQARFEQGLILNTQGQVMSLDAAYNGNQHIYYYRALTTEITVPFAHQILFEDDHLLVVDKPHFLTMSPTGQYVQQTLLVRLKQQTEIADLTPIHRLDRETAGLVLFCKTVAARAAYQQLFAKRQVQKTYHAIAAYRPELNFPHHVALYMAKAEPFYCMSVQPHLAANSFSEIKLLQHNTVWAKYELKPSTGKQHQLRVHMAHLGIPILHDSLYPHICHKSNDDFSQPLQLLAKSLSFIDPIDGRPRVFNSNFELHL